MKKENSKQLDWKKIKKARKLAKEKPIVNLSNVSANWKVLAQEVAQKKSFFRRKPKKESPHTPLPAPSLTVEEVKIADDDTKEDDSINLEVEKVM
jgi:hypothetical protein